MHELVVLTDRAGRVGRAAEVHGDTHQLRLRIAHVEARQATSLVLADSRVTGKAVLDLTKAAELGSSR